MTTPANPAGLREALETALSVVLHEELDPGCTGTPDYEDTMDRAKTLALVVMATPIVRAALLADPVPLKSDHELREAADALVNALQDRPATNLTRKQWHMVADLRAALAADEPGLGAYERGRTDGLAEAARWTEVQYVDAVFAARLRENPEGEG